MTANIHQSLLLMKFMAHIIVDAEYYELTPEQFARIGASAGHYSENHPPFWENDGVL